MGSLVVTNAPIVWDIMGSLGEVTVYENFLLSSFLLKRLSLNARPWISLTPTRMTPVTAFILLLVYFGGCVASVSA